MALIYSSRGRILDSSVPPPLRGRYCRRGGKEIPIVLNLECNYVETLLNNLANCPFLRAALFSGIRPFFAALSKELQARV